MLKRKKIHLQLEKIEWENDNEFTRNEKDKKRWRGKGIKRGTFKNWEERHHLILSSYLCISRPAEVHPRLRAWAFMNSWTREHIRLAIHLYNVKIPISEHILNTCESMSAIRPKPRRADDSTSDIERALGTCSNAQKIRYHLEGTPHELHVRE